MKLQYCQKLYRTVARTWTLDMLQIFCIEVVIKEGKPLRFIILIWKGQAWPATSKLPQTYNVCLWLVWGYGLIQSNSKLKFNLISNRTKEFLSQLNAHNLKLQTIMFSCSIRLQDSLIISISRMSELMCCTFCIEILIKKGIAESNSFSWVCWGNAQPFSNLPEYIRGILDHMRVAVRLQQFKAKVISFRHFE